MAARRLDHITSDHVAELVVGSSPANTNNALRTRDISIHRAWLLSKQPPAKQREELGLSECRSNIKKDMRALASRSASSVSTLTDPRVLLRKLFAHESSNPGSFRIFESLAPGKAIAITKELLLELEPQQELDV